MFFVLDRQMNFDAPITIGILIQSIPKIVTVLFISLINDV